MGIQCNTFTLDHAHSQNQLSKMLTKMHRGGPWVAFHISPHSRSRFRLAVVPRVIPGSEFAVMPGPYGGLPGAPVVSLVVSWSCAWSGQLECGHQQHVFLELQLEELESLLDDHSSNVDDLVLALPLS